MDEYFNLIRFGKEGTGGGEERIKNVNRNITKRMDHRFGWRRGRQCGARGTGGSERAQYRYLSLTHLIPT